MTLPPRTVVFVVGDADGAAAPPDARWHASGGRQDVEVLPVDRTADWWTSSPAAELAPDAPVVLVDRAWLPGPGLVERLVRAQRTREGALVDARVLPAEATRLPVDEGPSEPDAAPPSLRVSAACCLLPAASLEAVASLWRIPLGDGRAEALAHWAEAAGRELVVEPAATVFLPLRADGNGVLLGTVGPAGAGPYDGPANLHPAAMPSTSLASMLAATGLAPRELPEDPAQGRPFLSVVTRTQGTRIQCLEEALTCLAGQTNHDFELILACHRTSDAQHEAVRGVVGSQPSWLQERTRLLDVERPGRSAPLNEGFAAARGRYVAILDDDDTVLAHWVDTFAALEAAAPGRVLRAAALRQDVAPLQGHDELVAVSLANPFAAWSETFSFVDHLQVNHSPCMSVAFPRGVFHDLGLRFDESLPATEDWEYVVRAAGLVGATSSPEVTSVYRWWVNTASSRELHSQAEWDDARERVLASIDDSVLLLPPGAAAQFRERIEDASRQLAESRDEVVAIATSQHEVILRLNDTIRERDRVAAELPELTEELRRREERLAVLGTRLEKQKARLEKQKARFARWRELMAQADEQLQRTDSRAEHGSLFELELPELRELVAQLRAQPERRTRKWLR